MLWLLEQAVEVEVRHLFKKFKFGKEKWISRVSLRLDFKFPRNLEKFEIQGLHQKVPMTFAWVITICKLQSLSSWAKASPDNRICFRYVWYWRLKRRLKRLMCEKLFTVYLRSVLRPRQRKRETFLLCQRKPSVYEMSEAQAPWYCLRLHGWWMSR